MVDTIGIFLMEGQNNLPLKIYFLATFIKIDTKSLIRDMLPALLNIVTIREKSFSLRMHPQSL